MYIVKKIETIEYSPGAWTGCRLGVFRVVDGNEEKIGEYDRNYPNPYDTFFPFHLSGKDLALYSAEYTATRIMELPSCRDLGGEENSAGGFCPVDYFVPTYLDQEITVTSNNETFPNLRVSEKRVNNPSEEQLSESTQSRSYTNGVSGQACTDVTTKRPISSLLYYPFGFVAGCIWGDDSSWKIQYLDLSEADKGVIKREERFGYVEMPNRWRLKDAVEMYSYGSNPEHDYSNHIRLNIVQTFDVRDGRLIDPFE
ncbi:MAG: hypothetical protein ABI999_10060 [Acidobacteriota bacterium]